MPVDIALNFTNPFNPKYTKRHYSYIMERIFERNETAENFGPTCAKWVTDPKSLRDTYFKKEIFIL
jgi:hypothetical protein